MFNQISGPYLLIFSFSWFLISGDLNAQVQTEQHSMAESILRYDSTYASSIPELKAPQNVLKRGLPAIVDNSQNKFFSGIYSQTNIASCQQYCSIRYTFAYEINRLRNRDGKARENGYSALYTYNFGNEGNSDDGVSKFFSWDVLRQQGQMNDSRYPNDFDSTLNVELWASGYDNYFEGMHNRIKNIWSIPTNTAEGILTLKNWLYDHLDGSPTGGVAGFSAWSPNTVNMRTIPDGTPEAGKQVVISWPGPAVHGMVLVGYNDSIRYDLNTDGQYTNNIDINGDGLVTAADWEIGALILANCYGTWWANQGYVYVLYSSMAPNYGSGGIWNERVYVVEPDPAYSPQLTLKTTITFDSREKICVRAGIAADTGQPYPDHYLDFPIFHYQGGDFPMKGGAWLPGDSTLELGLDITELLRYATPGKPSRLFLEVVERDPYNINTGFINDVSFISYSQGVQETVCSQHDVEIAKNDVTRVSAPMVLNFDRPEITTEQLAAYNPSVPWTPQLVADGGKPPYTWCLERSFKKLETDSAYSEVTQEELHIQNIYHPYAMVILPFRFPFFGKAYDTVYVNQYGFVTFDPQPYPYPFVRDEEGMVRFCRCISPAFSIHHESGSAPFAWVESAPGRVIIRWQLFFPTEPGSLNNFELILYPDGKFEFRYGDMINPDPDETTYSGYSNGDNENIETWTNRDISGTTGRSFSFVPGVLPAGIGITEGGQLSLTGADPSFIYEIPVKVTDAMRVSSSKTFLLSGGLMMQETFVSDVSEQFIYGDPGYFDLLVTNNGPAALQGLTLTIESTDGKSEITDSTEVLESINPKQVVTLRKAFSFRLRKSCPDNFPVSFRITATSGNSSWSKDVTVITHVPQLSIGSVRTDDGDNYMLEPGEVAELVIRLNNTGSGDASGLKVEAHLQDSLLEILSGLVMTSDTLCGFLSCEIRCTVKGSRNAPPGSCAEIILAVESRQTGLLNFPLNVTVGKIPVGIISLTANSSSPYILDSILTELRVEHNLLDSVPLDLSNFASLFVILGNSPTGSHILSESEEKSLSTYLLKNGSLYMESYYSQWLAGLTRALYKDFRYSYEFVDVYNENQVNGIPGTFMDSMYFSYVSSFPYNGYNFIPVSPAYGIFRNADTAVRMLQIVYDGYDYRTIGSQVEFGLLKDSVEPSTKLTLMKRYLKIFDINHDGIYNYFHADSRDICNGHTIAFMDDSYSNIISRTWEFPGGTPAVSNEPNPVVHYYDPGDYDVRLTVSDGIHSRSVLKRNYIHVKNCNATDPEGYIAVLYPNPSKGTLHIKFLSGTGTRFQITLYDTGGKYISSWSANPVFPGEVFNFDISSLKSGLYFVRLNSTGYTKSARIIVP
jgi:PKD repeat protein